MRRKKAAGFKAFNQNLDNFFYCNSHGGEKSSAGVQSGMKN